MTWRFGDLTPMSFDFVMVDFPWRFEAWSEAGKKQKAPEAHYKTLSIEQCAAFPIADLGRGDALYWIWATHPMIDQQISLCRRLNLNFVTTGVWVKTTVNGKLGFGTGYRLRCASEPFIICTLGRPETVRNIRTAFLAPIGRHSEKPDEAYDIAERMMPKALRRADIFSRRSRPGWTAWGDEADKFDSEAA